MSERDDREPSLDPTSWLRARDDTGAGRSPGEPLDSSFDPRSWFSTTPIPLPEPAMRSRSPADRSPPMFETHGGKRQGLAIGTSTAIMLAGAVLAWSARPIARPEPTPTPAVPSAGTSVSSRTIILSGIADLAPSLLAAGFPPSDADAVTRRATTALGDDSGEIRLSYDYEAITDGLHLRHLTATRPNGTGITLTVRADGSLTEARHVAIVTQKLRIVRGELDAQSFYSSAVAAGISDVLVTDFANAFQFDFDLQREVAPGDIIEAGFEQGYSQAGDEVGAPVLVYASLSTAAKTRALYRFLASGEKQAEWFDSNGRSTKRALMRTPIEAARISSGFGMREHPILGFAKMHRGVDFAAPRGTPIYAAGDATVEFAGPKGPNGNFVKLRHDNGWETLYLHMNRIFPGVAAGGHVVQGQQIGEVGTTGRSTGPHLHYEVHIAGEAVNPLSIDTGSGRTLSASALAAFIRTRDRIDARRVAME